MKKFSSMNSKQEPVKKNTFDDKINNLLEKIEFEIDGENASSCDVKICNTKAFKEALKEFMSAEFKKEKKSLLENAKKAVYSGDSTWLDAELWKTIFG